MQPTSPGAGGQSTSQLSVLDLPSTNSDFKAFLKAYRWFKDVTRQYAEHRFPGDTNKQAAITSTPLLRVESQLVSQIITHYVNTAGVSMSASSLSERITSLRKLFYWAGRMFPLNTAEIVLSDISATSTRSHTSVASSSRAALGPTKGVSKKKRSTTLRGARYCLQIESLFLGLDAMETARYAGHTSVTTQKIYQKNTMRSGTYTHVRARCCC